MDRFWDLVSNEKVGRGEVDKVARTLHNATCLNRSIRSNDSLQRHVDNFRQLYMTGGIPHKMVTVHLIGMYRDLQQYNMCLSVSAWALQQDKEFANLTTVIIIIGVLAALDNTSDRCEELYRAALDFVPYDFCSYDLSHGAILPDRFQHVRIGHSAIFSTSILGARLIHGEWRSAYLTLETAFRDFPYDVDPYILDMLIRKDLSRKVTKFFLCLLGAAVSSDQDA